MGHICIAAEDDKNAEWFNVISGASDEALEFTGIQKLPPLEELVDQILSHDPKLVALDYRLNENQNVHDGKNSYVAGTVAQHIREKMSGDIKGDFPIVLVSAEGGLGQFFDGNPTAHDLFDRTFSKPKVNSEPQLVCHEMISLIDGYMRIGSLLDAGDEFWKIFNISEEEWRTLNSIEELELEISSQKVTHWVARILLKTVIDRSGLLLSRDDVWARLGIDKAKSDVDKLWAVFSENGLVYDGAFHVSSPRLWNCLTSAPMSQI